MFENYLSISKTTFFLLIDWDSTSPIAAKVLGEGLLVRDKQLSRIEDTQSRRSPHGS